MTFYVLDFTLNQPNYYLRTSHCMGLLQILVFYQHFDPILICFSLLYSQQRLVWKSLPWFFIFSRAFYTSDAGSSTSNGFSEVRWICALAVVDPALASMGCSSSGNVLYCFLYCNLHLLCVYVDILTVLISHCDNFFMANVCSLWICGFLRISFIWSDSLIWLYIFSQYHSRTRTKQH